MLLLLILLPLMGSVPLLLVRSESETRLGRWSCAVTGLTLLVMVLAVCTRFGASLDIPLCGIHFTLDGFRAIYGLVVSFMWFVSALLTPQYFRGHHHLRRYHFFFLLCLSFTLGVFLSADLYTTFLFFELMSLSSYAWVVQEESPDALDAGKNVLCEKPAARSYAEAEQMQQAQKRSGKVLNIGVVNRFNTSVNLIKKMIDAGELGEVYHIYLSFRAPRSIPGMGGWFTTKELSGGGALIDWGVHFLDLAMYCMGDPQPKTVSAEAYCKLGKNMHEYAYTSMWSRDVPDFDGTYDVDDFVTGMIRTEGPTITLNGAWAQNVNVNEMYIDFLGDKAGIRLQYGGKFSIYTSKDGVLYEVNPDYKMDNMFQKEIDAFVDCIRSGEKLTAHIDTVLITAKIMQAMYDSSEAHREINFQ